MTDKAKQPILYAGLDEAGRGCVIGPMAIAIVSATQKDRRWLAEIGARDSKLLSPKQREDLAPRIRERCWHRIIVAQPQEIDEAVRAIDRSLNTLEQDLISSLIREFQNAHADIPSRILSDALGRNTANHARCLTEKSLQIPHHSILARIKADRYDRTVAAASILAKTERDRHIKELHTELGVDFGSGYPSDPRTQTFLSSCQPGTSYIRWSWKTMREFLTEKAEGG